MIAGGKAGLYVDGRAVTALGPMAVAPGVDAVLAADLNYDFRTDLVVASPTGVAFLRQGADGRFTNVTRETGLPATITGAPACAVWAADVDTDGDLDVVLAPASGAPLLLRNNGDGTFAVQAPFAGVAERPRLRLGRPRRRGRARRRVPRRRRPRPRLLNLRGGAFQRRAGAATAAAVAAIVAARGDRRRDLRPRRRSTRRRSDRRCCRARRRARGARTALVAVDDAPTRPRVAGGRVDAADLDNNGAVDLIVPARRRRRRSLLGDGAGAVRRRCRMRRSAPTSAPPPISTATAGSS